MQHRSARVFRVVALLVAALSEGCKSHPESAPDAVLVDAAAPATVLASGAAVLARLVNRAAYIPPQCFAKTRPAGAGDRAKNPCFVCHTRAEAPNYANDDDLQLRLSLPPAVAHDPWTNLLDPPVAHAPRASDAEVLSYVRASNYFDSSGQIALAARESTGSDARDERHGYVPDAFFSFDDQGFDHRPDGSRTGWRAFAYYPFPAFFPTNGSADDVLVRLDPALQEDPAGRFDARVYALNLAIVEALVTRADVIVDAVDEAPLGVDLDLDGHLARATRVAYDASPDGSGKTRMRYVGRARDDARFAIAPGLFPIGTELFHTVRYLDVAPDGTVTMAARMKEVRYAKKVRWSSYAVARAAALRDAREQDESPDGLHEVHFTEDTGLYTARGWLLRGFIEDREGSLRPQTFEESAYCEGCHGGIGATTDSVFSMARKVPDGPARGWFHWSQRDLRGIAEPKRADGAYEYSDYLSAVGGGDDFRANAEVIARFFDAAGDARPAELAKLHADIATLLLPSAARALDLDRAYAAIVKTQRFDHGRDAVLAAAPNAYDAVPLGEPTGITRALVAAPLGRAPPLSSGLPH